jgi:hypothetical protein
MSLHFEAHHGNNWWDRLLNCWPFMIDTDSISSFGIGWIFTEHGTWKLLPRLIGNNGHLYMNALLFFRMTFWGMIPLGAFLHIRLSSTRLVQIGFGIKNNTGRIGLIFRFQTDASAARGSASPNPDQTGGFEWGYH